MACPACTTPHGLSIRAWRLCPKCSPEEPPSVRQPAGSHPSPIANLHATEAEGTRDIHNVDTDDTTTPCRQSSNEQVLVFLSTSRPGKSAHSRQYNCQVPLHAASRTGAAPDENVQ